jgi:hypothetical protein
MVWTFAHPAARVITIFEIPDGVEGEEIVYSTAKVLTLLHLCQESRQIAKKWYQLTFSPTIGSCKTARIYFDFDSDAAYIPFHRGVEQNHPNHSAGSPYSISNRARCKVTRVIHEVSQFSEQFLSASGYRPAATEALLVLYEEGKSQGDDKQSEFQPDTFQFIWQSGRTLYETYLDVPQRGEKDYTHRLWSLTKTQTVRFSGVVRDG